MMSDPATAATMSRSETDTLSRPGSRLNNRKSHPPSSAPTRPRPKLRRLPKPSRSQVISREARLPPIRPTTIQTTNCETDGIIHHPSFRPFSDYHSNKILARTGARPGAKPAEPPVVQPTKLVVNTSRPPGPLACKLSTKLLRERDLRSVALRTA